MRSKVLLVLDGEDKAGIADMLAVRTGPDFLVETVSTIPQAQDVMAADSFDAVLFDVGSVADGRAGEIGAMVAAARGTPLVVLTATEDEDAGALAVKAGAQDYLNKGRINPEALRRVIRYSIERMQFQRKYDRLARQNAERRRMEEALRESQDRIQAITESLFEGVLVTDIDGFVAFSNHSADRLLGNETIPRIAGRYVDSVFGLRAGGKVLRFADGPLKKVVETGRAWRDDDAVFEMHDGRSLVVAYACSPLIEDELRKGIIISFRDIQNLKRAQQDALQASKLASVGQLAAGIAHEINTPIQYIGDNLRFLGDALQTMLEMIEHYRGFIEKHGQGDAQSDRSDIDQAFIESDMDYFLAEMPQAIAQSLDGVGQVARIVLAMKEFSHPGEREKSAVDLNKAIENTLAVSRNEWKHVAEISLDLAEDLPAVHCLPGEINQVLLNLVVNAAQAIQSKGMKDKGLISVKTLRRGRCVYIAVTDDGIGMPESVRDRIFDPFFTTKAVGKGTGQGLAICRDVIVTKHSGAISVETEEGVGTTFTISLPIDGNPLTPVEEA
ncbi:ATP-binding protein [Telmatospirillum sp.]|uniref:hybrid sensor histidine kinase/response regulator n=1 Tax=Telmatospirillum sp. TaxID=2079197 RepID=UPI0028418DC2|nr:ATP-binding protein [Telmatospirillum sp.]MDR3435237.1 ATP-binding protein [Telmatospirillum sp.]